MEPANFDISRTALIPTAALDIEIVDVEPPAGGSFIELPGPRKTPRRPYLALSSGPAGLAARVMRGDGEILPLAVLVPEGPGEARVVSLPEPPLGLSRRTDGLWALYRTHLVHHDASGGFVRRVELTGNYLVASAADGAWVLSLDRAWHVDAAGTVHGPYPFGGGPASLASAADLCVLDTASPRSVRCVSPDGRQRTEALPVPAQPLDQLLSVREDRVLLQRGATLIWQRGCTGEELAVHGAGLDASGRAFVSSHQGSSIALYLAGRGSRLLAVPAEAATHAATSPAVRPPVRVAAVAGERVLAHDLDRMWWLEAGRVPTMLPLDEAAYRSEVFPNGWILATTHAFTAAPDGALFVSTTGPAGMAIVRIERR